MYFITATNTVLQQTQSPPRLVSVAAIKTELCFSKSNQSRNCNQLLHEATTSQHLTTNERTLFGSSSHFFSRIRQANRTILTWCWNRTHA